MKQHILAILASERRKLGLSQHELAVRAGLRREKVNRVESKAEDIGIDELSRLLDALGLELHVREKVQPKAVEPARSQAPSEKRLAPQDFRKAAFIDGAKAKILDWGKVPK